MFSIPLPIIIVVSVITICTNLVYYLVSKHRSDIAESQEVVSDKQIIEFINGQPDKFIDAQMLANYYDISKSHAKSRLTHLNTNGIVEGLYTKNTLKYYYTLTRPIEKPYDLKLSSEPFMTMEDLMVIFKHFDFKVSLMELCLSTGLPIAVIKREMKYFEKEKILKLLYKQNYYGS